MSKHGVFVFVEGDNDRYVYSKISALGLQDRSETYWVYKSDEIPGDGQGKSFLLNFYEIAKARDALACNFHGKRTGLVFFADNDADTLLGKAVASDHIIYTAYYDVENHVYVAGDLIDACAATCCLDPSVVRDSIGSQARWREEMAKQWKEWVCLCFFAKKHDLSSGATYSVPSKIHSQSDERLDSVAYDAFITDLKYRSAWTDEEFEQRLSAAIQEVERHYTNGQWDVLFKGRWYGVRLQRLMARINTFGSPLTPISGVNVKGDDFVRTISAKLDFRAAWANHFNQSFAKFLKCMT